jgi:hypothetical protein
VPPEDDHAVFLFGSPYPLPDLPPLGLGEAFFVPVYDLVPKLAMLFFSQAFQSRCFVLSNFPTSGGRDSAIFTCEDSVGHLVMGRAGLGLRGGLLAWCVRCG